MQNMQTYQTKRTKPDKTKLIQPSLLNQGYQTKPTKPNQRYWLKQSTPRPGSVVPLAMFDTENSYYG